MDFSFNFRTLSLRSKMPAGFEFVSVANSGLTEADSHELRSLSLLDIVCMAEKCRLRLVELGDSILLKSIPDNLSHGFKIYSLLTISNF